jgi:hypothetical protein
MPAVARRGLTALLGEAAVLPADAPAASRADPTASVIDVATQTELRRFRSGRAPNGVTWIPS